jgi:lysophospholipase L1-like esterase
MKKTLFILGDSISIAYTPFLKQYLGKSWQVTRKGDLPADPVPGEPEPENGGDSNVFLAYLKAMLPQIAAGTMLLNCGLHDIKHQPTQNSPVQVPLEIYQSNLRDAIQLIQSFGKKPVWVTTTAVDDARHLRHMREFFRYDAERQQYNIAAAQVMDKFAVPVIDLCGFTGQLRGELYQDHVHFTEEVSRLQAAYLAGALEAICGEL